MIRKLTYLIIISSFSLTAQDWLGIPVPANPGNGNEWELIQNVSDDFNYIALADNKGDAFTSKWKDEYVNGWAGGPQSVWEPTQSNVSGGYLNIESDRTLNTTDQIICGNISALNTIIYPVFLEAKVQMNILPMGNDFWMVSEDQTQEIDILEAFGTDRPEYSWFTERLHLSHHVFIREPFQDYQPQDEQGVEGTWYTRNGVNRWSAKEFTIGIFWRDPWHLEYYIDGEWIRTLDKFSYSYKNAAGDVVNKTTTFNIIDKFNYTEGAGLSKPMHILVDTGYQPWTNMIVTDEELNDPVKSVYKMDWLRVYKPVPSTLSVNEFNENKLFIYPNPVQNILNINGIENYSTMSIYNLVGAKVLSQPLKEKGIIDLSTISNGVYLLELIRKDSSVAITKIVINH